MVICPRIRKQNQESCYEPVEQFEFVNSSISQLLDRGVIGVWNPDWGESKVISPLKVVPKKGNTYRLILDLSKMNKYLRFPRFKYANINQTRDVFVVTICLLGILRMVTGILTCILLFGLIWLLNGRERYITLLCSLLVVPLPAGYSLW